MLFTQFLGQRFYLSSALVLVTTAAARFLIYRTTTLRCRKMTLSVPGHIDAMSRSSRRRKPAPLAHSACRLPRAWLLITMAAGTLEYHRRHRHRASQHDTRDSSPLIAGPAARSGHDADARAATRVLPTLYATSHVFHQLQPSRRHARFCQHRSFSRASKEAGDAISLLLSCDAAVDGGIEYWPVYGSVITIQKLDALLVPHAAASSAVTLRRCL